MRYEFTVSLGRVGEFDEAFIDTLVKPGADIMSVDRSDGVVRLRFGADREVHAEHSAWAMQMAMIVIRDRGYDGPMTATCGPYNVSIAAGEEVSYRRRRLGPLMPRYERVDKMRAMEPVAGMRVYKFGLAIEKGATEPVNYFEVDRIRRVGRDGRVEWLRRVRTTIGGEPWNTITSFALELPEWRRHVAARCSAVRMPAKER
jgi:hypothetical protein